MWLMSTARDRIVPSLAAGVFANGAVLTAPSWPCAHMLPPPPRAARGEGSAVSSNLCPADRADRHMNQRVFSLRISNSAAGSHEARFTYSLDPDPGTLYRASLLETSELGVWGVATPIIHRTTHTPAKLHYRGCPVPDLQLTGLTGGHDRAFPVPARMTTAARLRLEVSLSIPVVVAVTCQSK